MEDIRSTGLDESNGSQFEAHNQEARSMRILTLQDLKRVNTKEKCLGGLALRILCGPLLAFIHCLLLLVSVKMCYCAMSLQHCPVISFTATIKRILHRGYLTARRWVKEFASLALQNIATASHEPLGGGQNT